MTDPFEDFEFKPLTEGLGFHKKAEQIKHDVKSSTAFTTTSASSLSTMEKPAPRSKTEVARSTERSVPERSTESSKLSSLFSDTELSSKDSSARPASQSISDLIASLPPSLDFVEEKPEPAKPTSSKASMTATSPLKASSGPSLFESKDTAGDRPQIFQPLGRDDYKAPSGPTIGSMLPTPGSKAAGAAMTPIAPGAPAIPAVPAPTAMPKASPSPYRERLDESFARAFPHAEKSTKKDTGVDAQTAEGLQPTTVNLASGILDSMVVAGVSTILLVAILAITRVNLVGLLSNAQTDGPTQFNLGLLFLAVMQMYMLISRSFFGASLGEWAFDLQLGTEEDRAKLIYPVKVAWRTLLVTLTGIILLPLLSAILRKDLAARLTGLQLYLRP